MKIVRTKAELNQALTQPRRESALVGLVPTMGYLHAGHASLLRAAREQCDLVVMSLFVNPAQFGEGEDLERYPRDEARDIAVAAGAGVDVVYAPDAEEVYPDGFVTTVAVDESLTAVLCGDRTRRGPEHFRGVTTVVAMLFNSVGPDVAYFGQKDAQQAAVIRAMARDLDFPVRIAVLPTVREPDGLAMSSRNSYLDEEQRTLAPALYRSLETVRQLVTGDTPLQEALAAAGEQLRSSGIQPEYLEARDAESLAPASNLNGRAVLVAVAARVGETRLIDNIVIEGSNS